MKCNNIQIMVVPEREKSEKGILFGEIMVENFPNLVKEKITQVQETLRSMKMNLKRPTSRHILQTLNTQKKFKGYKREIESHL